MKNLLLNQFSQDDFNRLEPFLKITPFEQHVVLFEADQEIRHVYFPTSAIVSVAHTLQSAGLIKYTRGKIQILDAEAMHAGACECYETVKRHYARLLGPAK